MILNPFKRLRALEEAVKDLQDRYYKVELDTGEIKYLHPADAVIAYAPYVRKIQIGPNAENVTQMLLLAAMIMGHPNYRAIEFYDAQGADISRQMHQAFIDRGLANL